MKDGNWIGLHKNVRHWLPKNRRYTELEALVSVTLDRDEGKPGTINGYASLWGWSRCKARRFLTGIEKTGEGYLLDRHKTVKGQEVFLKLNNLVKSKRHLQDTCKTLARHEVSLKLNNLQDRKDTCKTLARHLQDTTINTNTNTKKKKKPGGSKNDPLKPPGSEKIKTREPETKPDQYGIDNGQKFVRWVKDQYPDVTVAYSKDGGAFKKFKTNNPNFTSEQIAEAWHRYMKCEEPFYAEHSITKFLMSFSKFRSNGNKPNIWDPDNEQR